MLTKSDDRIRFVRERAEDLLKKAKPLMDIYRSDRKEAYSAAMRRLWEKGDRLTVSAALPLFTLSQDALASILARLGLSRHRHPFPATQPSDSRAA